MLTNPVAPSGQPIALPTSLTQPSSGVSPATFSNLLEHALGGAAESHQTAQAAVRELAMGQTDNLHGVMMQVAQADLSFRLILEIRNRLTEAYQDIMKMQV